MEISKIVLCDTSTKLITPAVHYVKAEVTGHDELLKNLSRITVCFGLLNDLNIVLLFNFVVSCEHRVVNLTAVHSFCVDERAAVVVLNDIAVLDYEECKFISFVVSLLEVTCISIADLFFRGTSFFAAAFITGSKHAKAHDSCKNYRKNSFEIHCVFSPFKLFLFFAIYC